MGASAIYFSCIFPFSKIYCFEPDSNSRKLLLENLRMNKVDSSVFGVVISDRSKKIYFQSNVKNPAFSGISDKKEGNIVDAISLEEVFNFLDIDFVDLIKVDIEGEEINMLEGLNKSSKKIGKFICEVHYNKYEISSLKNHFTKKGFTIWSPLPHWKFLNNEIDYPIMIAENKHNEKNKGKI